MYGKQFWARYPAGPSSASIPCQILSLSTKNIEVDLAAEAKRPALNRETRGWAGIAQNPKLYFFVFVSRWSKQNSVDLIYV